VTGEHRIDGMPPIASIRGRSTSAGAADRRTTVTWRETGDAPDEVSVSKKRNLVSGALDGIRVVELADRRRMAGQAFAEWALT
jgi:hypothetical protein